MFHSDWEWVTAKIKQNELDCRDTAPLTDPFVFAINTSAFSTHSDYGNGTKWCEQEKRWGARKGDYTILHYLNA